MESATNPAVGRRRLGIALRELREGAGMTGEQAGSAVERSGSWISRVEAGRVGLRSRDLRDLVELYGLNDPDQRQQLEALARDGKRRGWWSRYTRSLPESYALFIGLEDEAQELYIYGDRLVPGLLQTEAYCRALFNNAVPPISEAIAEDRIRVRLTRQEILGRPNPPDLHVVLDEGALQRVIGDAGTQREQLSHLAKLAERPFIRIQVVPFDRGTYPTIAYAFVVVRLAGGMDVVHVETVGGGLHLDGAEVEQYLDVHETLRTAALSVDDSVSLIHQRAVRLND